MTALFRNPVIRHMTMKCGFIWFSITMVYYVISLGKMPGFIPTNNVVNGIMELIILWLPFVSDKSWFHRSKVLSGKEFKYEQIKLSFQFLLLSVFFFTLTLKIISAGLALSALISIFAAFPSSDLMQQVVLFAGRATISSSGKFK